MKLKLKYDELSERYQNNKLGNRIPLNWDKSSNLSKVLNIRKVLELLVRKGQS